MTLVDVFGAFGVGLSLLGFDGLHANAAGYQRIADAFRTEVVDVLEQP